MAHSKVIVGIAVLLLITLFFFIGFIFQMGCTNQLTIDQTIVPLDIIGLIVSLLVAIWLGWYITKKLNEQRFEKDILIKDLQQIEDCVNQIKQTFENSTCVDISFIATKIGYIHQLKQRFSKTDKMMKYNTPMVDINVAISELYQYSTGFDMNYVPIESVDNVALNNKCDNVINCVRALIISVNNR